MISKKNLSLRNPDNPVIGKTLGCVFQKYLKILNKDKRWLKLKKNKENPAKKLKNNKKKLGGCARI